METPINSSYDNFISLKKYLLENKQLDYSISVENDFRKNLLISSASFIESSVQSILIDFVNSNSSHSVIVNFLKNKAISRQYHSYFDWNGKNINGFLGLFGPDFRDSVKQSIKEKKLEEKIKSFIELGKLRNELVHQNFILYTIEKTADEIKVLFDEAEEIVDFLDSELKKLT